MPPVSVRFLIQFSFAGFLLHGKKQVCIHVGVDKGFVVEVRDCL